MTAGANPGGAISRHPRTTPCARHRAHGWNPGRPVVERVGGAGTGGAGLLTCLKTLGYAAAAKGWHMAYTSDYNPETRGGLVEGTVVLSSDEPIDNPVIESYTAVLAFDHAGYLSYGPGVEPGGLILWDSSRVRNPPPLEGVRSYGVPVFQLARDGGAPGLANMGMLGLYNRIAGHFTIDELLAGMEDYLPVWRHKLLPGNRAVLEAVSRIDPEEYRVA